MISRHASLVFKNENVVFDIHRYCQQKKFDCQTMGEGKFHHRFQTHSLLLSTLSEQNWTDCDQY